VKALFKRARAWYASEEGRNATMSCGSRRHPVGKDVRAFGLATDPLWGLGRPYCSTLAIAPRSIRDRIVAWLEERPGRTTSDLALLRTGACTRPGPRKTPAVERVHTLLPNFSPGLGGTFYFLLQKLFSHTQSREGLIWKVLSSSTEG